MIQAEKKEGFARMCTAAQAKEVVSDRRRHQNVPGYIPFTGVISIPCQQSCRDGLRMSALLVGEGEEMNITKMIQENIRATASRRNDEGIITAEGMIPRMDDKEYHRKHLDISYAGRTPAEKLDIFYPEEGDGPFPVLWKFMEGRGILDKSVP